MNLRRAGPLSSFLGCDPHLCDSLARIAFSSRFRAGEVIASSDEDPPLYGLVQEGAARSCLCVPGGKTYTTGLWLRGQIIPPFQHPGSGAVRRLEATLETSLYCFPADELEWALCKSGEANRAFRQLLSETVDASGQWMMVLGRKTVEEKLTAFLLHLLSDASDASQANAPVEIPLTRSQMAEFLGMTPESVSRTLSSLKRSRIIRLCDMRTFQVLDRQQLAAMAGEPLDEARGPRGLAQ
jgi:CRP/FNR family transcriptional regulator